jgi:hypothetical protein
MEGPIMNSAPEMSNASSPWSRVAGHEQIWIPNRRATRASGFVGSIAVNAILLYAAHHVLDWQIGWITPAWSDVLWAVDLTLWASIVANALFLAIDAAWFRNLAGAISCAFAVLATWWLYVVFPFDFEAAATNDVVRLALGALVLATALATVVMAILALVELVRSALRT